MIGKKVRIPVEIKIPSDVDKIVKLALLLPDEVEEIIETNFNK